MKTYHLRPGDMLVFSVNEAAWETVEFAAKDFDEIGAARADELTQVLNRGGTLAADVGEQGALVLATPTAGTHTSLDVDGSRSTAAASVGLTAALSARGEGLRAARLVGQNVEPFALAADSELALTVDASRRRVTFDEGFKMGAATAAEVARIINGKKKKVAEAMRDGRVALTSNTVGAGSQLLVKPAPAEKKDAAVALGFVGAAAYDEPHRVAPARLTCAGHAAGLSVFNSTAGPVELHLPSSTMLLPAGGSLPLAPGDDASEHLRRLVEQDVVRLGPGV
jgi:hypothetical protein